MEEKTPLHPDNKVYTFADLKPKFVKRIESFFRKLKLKSYKNKKVKQSKTDFHRNYHMKFKIHISDNYNPQVTDTEYEMVIPAKAIFFAKMFLNKTIKEKIVVELVDWEELSDEENVEYLKSVQEFVDKKDKTTD